MGNSPSSPLPAPHSENILGIETSSEICGVALLANGREFSLQRSSRRRHSEILMELAEKIIHRARLQFSDLQALAVDVGPGSYTGLRVGIMTAKALSFALGLRAAPVPSLLALAHSVAVSATAALPLIAPCLAGLGNEVYTALYKRKTRPASGHKPFIVKEGGGCDRAQRDRALVPPRTQSVSFAMEKRGTEGFGKEMGLTKLEDFRRIGIEEWLEHLSRSFFPGRICFAGSGVSKHRDLILRRGFRISPQVHPQALWIARLGRSQLLRQAASRPLNPIYLKSERPAANSQQGKTFTARSSLLVLYNIPVGRVLNRTRLTGAAR